MNNKFIFLVFLFGMLFIPGCTSPTTLSYEPEGASDLIPPMHEYTKVDLEGQTATVAGLVTGAVSGTAGANPAAAAYAGRKMQLFTDCLAENDAVVVKGFYSKENPSAAVIAVGEGDSKKMMACALKSAFTASIINTKNIYVCTSTYATKSPSGKEYYVGMIGFDTEEQTVCEDLCKESINGCKKVEKIGYTYS